MKKKYVRPETVKHDPSKFVTGNSEATLYQTYYY